MIHVQKVTLVAFALHDGKPPDTETLLVVLDQYVLLYSRKISLMQNFVEMLPDPPEEIFTVFTFAERNPFKPHPYQMISTPLL